ncbi:MAG: hypothetical protein HY290_18560 [Planctomycetia bacterium]|nr:hypothetical protein [Planctomycetia bacterium]
MRLMVDGPNLTLERAVSYDRLRRKIERWSDLLVGHVVRRFGLADFAYDADRALEFGDEQDREARGTRQDQIWDLYFLCLRSSFPEFILPGGVHGERRTEVCRSILSSFPESLFLGDGTMISTGLMRILAGDSVAEGPPAGNGAGADVIKWPKPARRFDGLTERRGWN